MVHRNAPLSETSWLRLARCVVEAGWTRQPEVNAPSSWDIRVTSWEAHSAAMSSSRLTFDAAPQSTPRLLQQRDALSLLGHPRPRGEFSAPASAHQSCCDYTQSIFSAGL